MHFPLYFDAFSGDNCENISKCYLMQPKNLTPPIIFPVGTPHEMHKHEVLLTAAHSEPCQTSKMELFR